MGEGADRLHYLLFSLPFSVFLGLATHCVGARGPSVTSTVWYYSSLCVSAIVLVHVALVLRLPFGITLHCVLVPLCWCTWP